MSHTDLIHAWKDPEYRATLPFAPAHPAGLIELADPDLGGGATSRNLGFRHETVRNISTTKGGACKTFDCTLSTHHKCCP
jgi:mersacidin/lichenicidin family type 2 lantibiotic